MPPADAYPTAPPEPQLAPGGRRMTGRERFRRRGPPLELAPGCWICVAGVTAIQPADPADGGAGLTVVEADGRHVVLPLPAVMAQAVADAMLDWGPRARAGGGGGGRLPAPGRPRGPCRRPPGVPPAQRSAAHPTRGEPNGARALPPVLLVHWFWTTGPAPTAGRWPVWGSPRRRYRAASCTRTRPARRPVGSPRP